MLPLCSATSTAMSISSSQMILRPVSSSLPAKIDVPLLTNIKTSVDQLISTFSTSLDDSISKGQNALKTSIHTVDSIVDRTGQAAGNKVVSFSIDLKDSAAKAALFGVELFRRTIVAVDDSLANGAHFALQSYQSAKLLLPPQFRVALDSYEYKADAVLTPTKIALHKVYEGIQGLEATLGLDPNDPIIPFLLLLATSTSLWVFYWVLTYSGYAGDLSPQLTLDALSGKENTLLVDIRPEVLREKDGIPDLRRSARYRYASVSVPEVGGSQRNLFKNVLELEDALTASVIRNLKISQDRSKVIVMDADGGRSKQVARSLQKLGIKEPYLVRGGFRSWVKEGLRIKELKPETTFTILNEEAEAILEEINPSPFQVFGLCLGLIVASYALLEWETTLQYIGVVGLGQSIFRRITSYDGAEDFNKDIGLLLTPARIGSEAFSWAARKLETNRVGLPTSPSSKDVQNRVLQAAAKHTSESADQSPPLTDKVDLSEA